MNDDRVAVFTNGRRVRIYHVRKDRYGTGMTMCGLLFDSTCKRTDAIRGRLRKCWKCAKAENR